MSEAVVQREQEMAGEAGYFAEEDDGRIEVIESGKKVRKCLRCFDAVS
jgi:hypothetical protein